GLRSDVGGRSDIVGQGSSDGVEALVDGLPDGIGLAGAFRLRRGERLQVAAQVAELGLQELISWLPAGGAQRQPEGQRCEQQGKSDENRGHAFSRFTGNGALTLKKEAEEIKEAKEAKENSLVVKPTVGDMDLLRSVKRDPSSPRAAPQDEHPSSDAQLTI